MGHFDQAGRFAAHDAPEVLWQRLLAPSGAAFEFRGWDETRTVTPPHGQDRTADLVAVFHEPAAARDWLLIVEIQSEHDPQKLDVTLQEVAALRIQARHGAQREGRYAVLTAMIYLQGTCPNATLEMTLPNGAGTKHTALVWNVAYDDAVLALDDIANGRATPGLLYWVPLMQGADLEANVVRWKELVFEKTASARQRGNMIGIAWVFSELAGRGQVWKRVMENLEMPESQVVANWINQGEERGEQRARRADILDLIQIRFPDQLAPEFRQLINEQMSLPLLQDWFHAAARAYSYEQFEQHLRR